MAKDPNYDRYAGIESLPGPDGKLPQPFRVDEDGNVIYRDEERGTGRPMSARKSRDLARAGILGWDELDRKLDGQPATSAGEVLATASRGSAGAGNSGAGIALPRKTVGGIDYNVISANTYDPTRSNGKTALPNAEMIAIMNADMNQIAVPRSSRKKQEKATRIARLSMDSSTGPDNSPPSEKNLPLINPKTELYYSVPAFNTKAKSRDDVDTLQFSPVEGLVAYGHGHIDGTSDGMIDKWNPSRDLHGDIESLRGGNPVPMATVSEGRIGWYQLEDGRLQFMYPVGSYSGSKKDQEEEQKMIKIIQENLDRQQSLFYRK